MEQNQLKNTQKIIKKKFSNGESKSERQKQLEKEYVKKGLNKEQAEAEAYNRAGLEKVMKVAAGIAVAAVVSYAAYKGIKHINKYRDFTVKAGETFQRITKNGNEDSSFSVYATPNSKDKEKYKGLLGKTFRDQEMFFEGKADPKIHQIEFDAQRKMKIAGEKKGKKVFEQLMKNDSEFAKDVKEAADYREAMGHVKQGKTTYDEFNRMLVDRGTDENKRATSKFYKALKDQGYDGVIDVNDRHYSGYRAKKPMILFNTKDGVGNRRVRELSNEEITESVNKAWKTIGRQMNNEKLEKKLIKTGGRLALATAAIAATNKASISGRESIVKKNQTRQQQLIKLYKKDHPKTKLSDRQILDRIYGYKR